MYDINTLYTSYDSIEMDSSLSDPNRCFKNVPNEEAGHLVVRGDSKCWRSPHTWAPVMCSMCFLKTVFPKVYFIDHLHEPPGVLLNSEDPRPCPRPNCVRGLGRSLGEDLNFKQAAQVMSLLTGTWELPPWQWHINQILVNSIVWQMQ